ncbi:MAG: M48 family metallopeptidase [Alphaproteobacteria bacterium]
MANRTFDVSVNRLKRARRLTMRVDTNKRLVKISAPNHVDTSTVRAFLLRNQGWLVKQIESRPQSQIVQEGSVIPFKGQEREIVVREDARTISVDEPGLIVLPRRGEPVLRLQRFLVSEASKDLRDRAERLSDQLGRPFRSLRVRDTKTRWGSCSSKAGLNFSWRLIFAEDWIREYVVAHEVAHLRHMDHSPAFWAQCQALCPPGLDINEAKAVLRRDGNRWHALIFDGSAGR